MNRKIACRCRTDVQIITRYRSTSLDHQRSSSRFRLRWHSMFSSCRDPSEWAACVLELTGQATAAPLQCSLNDWLESSCPKGRGSAGRSTALQRNGPPSRTTRDQQDMFEHSCQDTRARSGAGRDLRTIDHACDPWTDCSHGPALRVDEWAGLWEHLQNQTA